MKTFVFIVIFLIALFMFTLKKSGALEKKQEWVDRGGVRVYEPVNHIDWDKYFDFINIFPSNVDDKAGQFFRRKKSDKDSLKIDKSPSGTISVTKEKK